MAVNFSALDLPDSVRVLLSSVRLIRVTYSEQHRGCFDATISVAGRTGTAVMSRNLARLAVGSPDPGNRGPAGWGCEVMQQVCRELGEHAYWLLREIEDQGDAALAAFNEERERSARRFRVVEYGRRRRAEARRNTLSRRSA